SAPPAAYIWRSTTPDAPSSCCRRCRASPASNGNRPASRSSSTAPSASRLSPRSSRAGSASRPSRPATGSRTPSSASSRRTKFDPRRVRQAALPPAHLHSARTDGVHPCADNPRRRVRPPSSRSAGTVVLRRRDGLGPERSARGADGHEQLPARRRRRRLRGRRGLRRGELGQPPLPPRPSGLAQPPPLLEAHGHLPPGADSHGRALRVPPHRRRHLLRLAPPPYALLPVVLAVRGALEDHRRHPLCDLVHERRSEEH